LNYKILKEIVWEVFKNINWKSENINSIVIKKIIKLVIIK
jgi:hypothetical protein